MIQSLTLITALITLTLGSVALFLPHAVQKWLVNDPLRRRVMMALYGELIESSGYIVSLRVKGLIFVLLSFMLLW